MRRLATACSLFGLLACNEPVAPDPERVSLARTAIGTAAEYIDQNRCAEKRDADECPAAFDHLRLALSDFYLSPDPSAGPCGYEPGVVVVEEQVILKCCFWLAPDFTANQHCKKELQRIRDAEPPDEIMRPPPDPLFEEYFGTPP